MPALIDDLLAVLKTAVRNRGDQGGGDSGEDEARRLRIEADEDELDEMEEEV